MVVLLSRGNVFGPFCNTEQAEAWGKTNLLGFEYRCEELVRPGTTYLTCSADDIDDLVRTELKRKADHEYDNMVYVTVEGVNWAVQS